VSAARSRAATVWPVAFAQKGSTAEEAKIGALVKKAAS
jgi:hypothetical protein